MARRGLTHGCFYMRRRANPAAWLIFNREDDSNFSDPFVCDGGRAGGDGASATRRCVNRARARHMALEAH